MVDINIGLKIPTAKIEQARAGWLQIYPNTETIADPEWVDPEDGTDAPQVAKYTDAEWFAEKIRRNAVRDIRR